VGPGDIPLAFKNALHRAGKTPAEKATDVARDFVAMALVQPTLKMMRESNHAPPPFGPGEAEKKFGSMLDAQQARSIVGSKNFPLIDAVRDRLMGVPSAPAVWPAHGAREVTAIPPAQLASNAMHAPVL
jgi:Rod binding domain-containing protein